MGEKKHTHENNRAFHLMFTQRISAGSTIFKVCEEAGMPDPATIYRWMRAEPDFRKLYDDAVLDRASGYSEKIGAIADRVMDGTLEPDRARVAMDGYKWIATKLLPAVFGDKQQINMQVEHTHKLHLDALKVLSQAKRRTEVIDITPETGGEGSLVTRAHAAAEVEDAVIVTPSEGRDDQ